MSAYLHGPHEDDLTTECGSHILDELYEKDSGDFNIESLVENSSLMPDEVHSVDDKAITIDVDSLSDNPTEDLKYSVIN